LGEILAMPMYPSLRVSPHTKGRKLLRKLPIVHPCGYNMSTMDWSNPAIVGYISKWVKLAMRHLWLQFGHIIKKREFNQRKQGQFGDIITNSNMYIQ
jgi:hypothetical protein